MSSDSLSPLPLPNWDSSTNSSPNNSPLIRLDDKTWLKNLFNDNDFSDIPLKEDNHIRPLWINPKDFTIILENHSPLAKQAKDFLNVIAEPLSRPKFILEYKLTTYSLYAALSIGLNAKDIIDMLDKLAKSKLADSIINFINKCCYSFSKAKLVLKTNRFFIESSDLKVLKKLLQEEVVNDARILSSNEEQDKEDLLFENAPSGKGLKIAGVSDQEELKEEDANISKDNEGEDIELNLKQILDKEEDGIMESKVYSFEIKSECVESIKKRCQEIELPLLEEYDFRNDNVNPTLEIQLKPRTQLRPYQSKSLNKMFSNGRARSGIIVLPCGAGKTLTGIAATCTIGKSCLILCTSAVSVSQWKSEFLRWSTIKPNKIATFTSGNKEFYNNDVNIVITTYSMVSNIKNRSHSSKKMMDFLQSKEWGFLLLDEVHVVPANMFRQVVTKLHCHTKLGLTATLVREDDKITDLNFLIGPKLYEANWMDLATQGHIANVECAEVWCDMTPEFYREYLNENSRKKQLLYTMNPIKFQACQYLIQLHESKGDKIIVFSDNVFALKSYALKLKKPFIYGATSQLERIRILQQFKYNPLLNTIFLSKVGDTSIDIPEATVLIQISAHYGSRRQEAQRLGRILRPKKKNNLNLSKFNAFFYSLVSKDTIEMYYSNKRQQFLINQGYEFKIITQLKGNSNIEDLVYPTQDSQLELLQTVLMVSEKELESESEDDIELNLFNEDNDNEEEPIPEAKRIVGNMKSLSGADKMAYIEYNRPVQHMFRNKQLESSKRSRKK